MRRNSLVRRAIFSVLLIETLCAIAFVSSTLWHEWHGRMHGLDVALQGRSDSLIGAVQDAEDPEDNVTVNPEEFTPDRGDIYAVFNASGRLIGASQNTLPGLTIQQKNGFRDLRFAGHRYRVLQRQALRIIDREETHGVGLRRPFTLVYATTTDHLWHEIVESTQFYVALTAGLLCVTALVLIWLLRRLLAPLEQLAGSASRITMDTLAFEPPVEATRVQELAPLVEALSAMVARVREAFDRQHRFINDAAHELKTAVAVVRSSIQVLSIRQRTAQEYRAGLDQVLSDNERVEGLVRQMLTLASLEGRDGPAEGHCDLAEEAGHVLATLSSVAEVHGVSLQGTADAAVAVDISCDAARTLVSNLVLNAIQHSPAGAKVLVSVTAAATREAILRVQDFGSGIAPENLDRIFERFFREDASRSRATGGAGLGLAICKSIVEAANGRIQVQSEPGEGTRITVILPMASDQKIDELRAATPLERTLKLEKAEKNS